MSYTVCGAATLAPLWLVKYLPMVDLPQHAAQVSILSHLHDPAFGFAGHYVLNWFEPYWIGYGTTWLLAQAIGVPAALKAVLSAAVLLLPLSLRALLGRAGGEPDWAILGFPTAFGYAFYGGFFTYLVAVPMGLFFLAQVYAFAEAATIRRGAALAAAGVALFFCHFVVFAVMGLAAAAVLATSLPPRRWWLGAAAGALPTALALAWTAHHSMAAGPLQSHLIWALSLRRLAALPTTVIGFHGQLATAACFFVLMTLPAFGGLRFVRSARRLAPLALLLALYLFVPDAWAAAGGGLGSGFLYQRLAIFFVPFVLLSFSSTATPAQQRWGPRLTTAAVLGWSAMLAVQFTRFDREARAFDEIAAELPLDASYLFLTFDKWSPAVPGVPVFDHFGGWVQAAKGGTLGYSFAQADFQAAQLWPRLSPKDLYRRMLLDVEPNLFQWEVDGPYGWFFVRAREDESGLFPQGKVGLVRHVGEWWLYRATGLTAGSPAH